MTPGSSATIGERFARTVVGRRVSRMVFQPRGAEPGEVFLNQRRVFILPTRAGLLLALMLVALLLGSINYSLSLGFALTFLVVGIAWVGMLMTFRNLAHLHLRPVRVDPVFCGDPADYRLVLRNAATYDRYAIELTADPVAGDPGFAAHADPASLVEQDVTIPVRTHRRGMQPMPRITLATRFPLGLWRAWCYWQPALSALVYPRPSDASIPLPVAAGDGRESRSQRVRGSEDFAGMRTYAVGDPIRHIAWRAMARNPDSAPLSKQFDGGASGEAWLSLDAALAHARELESALAILARWILDAEAQALRYGLDLPGTRIALDRGPAHRAACLRALALYEA